MAEDRLVIGFVLLLDWMPILGLVWLVRRRFHRWWLLLACAYLVVGACYTTYGTAVTLIPAEAITTPEPWSVDQVAAMLALVFAATVAWPLFMVLGPFV